MEVGSVLNFIDCRRREIQKANMSSEDNYSLGPLRFEWRGNSGGTKGRFRSLIASRTIVRDIAHRVQPIALLLD